MYYYLNIVNGLLEEEDDKSSDWKKLIEEERRNLHNEHLEYGNSHLKPYSNPDVIGRYRGTFAIIWGGLGLYRPNLEESGDENPQNQWFFKGFPEIEK